MRRNNVRALVVLVIILGAALAACQWEVTQVEPGRWMVRPYPTNVNQEFATITPSPEAVEPTATPAPVGCLVGLVEGWRIRLEPTTTAALVIMSQNVATPVEAVGYRINSLSWVQVTGKTTAGLPITGWIAVGGVISDDRCYEGMLIARRAGGSWVGPGIDLGQYLDFADTLTAAGILPAATVYGADEILPALAQHGVMVALRPWLPDCPLMALPPRDSAWARVQEAVAATHGKSFYWLVLTNECVWPSAAYAHEWIRASIEFATAAGIEHLVPVVWPTGHPELGEVEGLADAYRDALIDVAWGINVYPFTPGVPLSEVGGATAYTTWRYKMYRAQLPEGVGILVTEAARGDGSEVPDFEDLAAWWEMTEGDFVFTTFWYAAGPQGLGHWPKATLWGKLGALAEAMAG